jgi:hypothetical protein
VSVKNQKSEKREIGRIGRIGSRRTILKIVAVVLALLALSCLSLSIVWTRSTLNLTFLEEVRSGEARFSQLWEGISGTTLFFSSSKASLLFRSALLWLLYLLLCLLIFRILWVREHQRSNRSALLVSVLAAIEWLVLEGLRVGMIVGGSLSSRSMRESFYKNGGILQIVLLVLTFLFGFLFFLSRRSQENSTPLDTLSESKIRAGLLGALNADGYEISDLILTQYDGKKVCVLLFDSEEAWDASRERQEEEKIVALCEKLEPAYEIRFEAALKEEKKGKEEKEGKI